MESVEEKDLIWSQVCGGHPREVTVTESQLKDEWAWLGRENSMGSGLEMGGRDQFQGGREGHCGWSEGEREAVGGANSCRTSCWDLVFLSKEQ